MADYRYLLADTSLGKNLAELPLVGATFSRVLSGIGQFSAQLPVTHPKATSANLDGDREITVLRDDVPIWNGPVWPSDADRAGGMVTLTGLDPTWYLTRRILEIDKAYVTQDLFDIVRDLVTYATSKKSDGTTTGTTSINATIPRFGAGAGTAGVTKSTTFQGAQRLFIYDLIQSLAVDPTQGFDYRVDYANVSGSRVRSGGVGRTLTLGAPSLGATLTQVLTEHVLYNWGRQSDRERAASRVHVLGSGYVYALQNMGSVTAGDILLEGLLDKSGVADTATIQSFANEYRRLAQPPVLAYRTQFIPGSALPFGFADLGDKLHLKISGPGVLAIDDVRRVVQIDVQPPSGSSPEIVSFTYNLPLDKLGV